MILLRKKRPKKLFLLSGRFFQDEVVVYFFRRRRARPTASVQNEDKKFFHGSLQIQLPREEEIGDEVENDADDQLADEGDGKDGIACLHAGEARPRGEAVAEEICQNRDGRELHELEEHEDGHGGEGALVLIES